MPATGVHLFGVCAQEVNARFGKSVMTDDGKPLTVKTIKKVTMTREDGTKIELTKGDRLTVEY